jgi:hypothetical protein
MLVAPLLAQAGAWGPDSFENDDALDWVGDCADGKSQSAVRAAFAAVMQGSYVQAPDASAAVAAAEVVAAVVGRPHPSPPTELAKCIKRNSTQELRSLLPEAQRALARIRDPKVSELSQLWADTKSNDWSRAIADLEARLAR